MIATLEQDDKCPGADTADTDDLASHVDDLEALEELPSIILQRLPVGAELVVNGAFELVDRQTDTRGELTKRDDDRRLTDDAVLAIHHFGKFRQGLQAVASVCLLGPLLGSLDVTLAATLRPTRLSCSRVVFFTARRRSSSDKRAYQMFSVPISANWTMVFR